MKTSPLDLENSPVFKLLIDGAACRFEVRLNDVPILQNETGLPYDVEFPVSEWMVDGENVLSAWIRPPAVYSEDYEEIFDEEGYDEEDSWLKLALVVKKNGADGRLQKKIATLDWLAGNFKPPMMGHELSSRDGIFDSTRGFERDEEEGDVTVSECEVSLDEDRKEVVLSRVITLPFPHGPWQWLAGEEIPDDDETLASLEAEYRKAWSLLSSGDVGAVENLIAVKASEYAAAYYLESEDEIEDAMAVTLLMQADDLSLASFGEGVELEVFGDGRLARLIDEDLESPIVFVSPDDVAYYLSFTYCRIDGAWALAR
jgi:hypothetical protein